MSTDAKCGLLVGVGVVLAVGVMFYRNDPPAAAPNPASPAAAVKPPAPEQSIDKPPVADRPLARPASDPRS